MKKMLLLFLLASGLAKIHAQAPVFNTVTPSSTSITTMDKFELTIDLTAAYTNPYDYSDIVVQSIFTAPSGKKDTVDGFYMEDYTLSTADGNITPAGTHHFKVRYAPKEAGNYSYLLMCTNKSGTAMQPAQTFTSTASAAHGFVRTNGTNYLSFDDGSQYIPVGENMCWQDGNVYNDYTKWLPKLTSNGGNYIRIWMSDWAFAYEWKNGSNGYQGLENYKQSNAFNLDWLLDYCSQQNVYIMLCLNHHGQVSTNVNPEWGDNPYNAANGGPCANTWDFFTSTAAKDYYKNRMRYLVARCGYSKNIMSWELFNEVVFTDSYDTHAADVDSWHNEMSSYLKTIDVNKHLVTTSFGGASYNPATWTYPNIDFTQIHTYSSVPNIENQLVAADQNYLAAYKKPVLNGEFGLGPSGAALSADDAAGVHIHNAIWASALGGALGTAMTWWWDDYIEPKNLYYHYQPLSSFLNTLSLKEDNYRPATATTSGGGTTDLTVSPGTGWGKAPQNNFTIDANGTITPDASQLGQYIYGSVWNTENRNPPTFNVTYPADGQFKVNVGAIGTDAKVTITVDGTQALNAAAVANTTFSVNITAGSHSITVDNSGTDWFNVSGYVFTNIGSPLSVYTIKSADSNKVAGYVLNTEYNWQYLKNNGTAPPAITGAMLMVPGLKNGQYTIQFYSCSTGAITGTQSVVATSNTLLVALPAISWDVAYTIVNNAVFPVTLASFTGQTISGKNVLTMNIAEATNVSRVLLERSADAVTFTTLTNLGNNWRAFTGTHNYTDAAPLPGSNYYRLKIEDANGSISTSNVVLLNINDSKHFSVAPNPAKDYVQVFADAGTYTVRLADAQGKTVAAATYTSASSAQGYKIPVAKLSPGVYYLSVTGKNGKVMNAVKVVKE